MMAIAVLSIKRLIFVFSLSTTSALPIIDATCIWNCRRDASLFRGTFLYNSPCNVCVDSKLHNLVQSPGLGCRSFLNRFESSWGTLKCIDDGLAPVPFPHRAIADCSECVPNAFM